MFLEAHKMNKRFQENQDHFNIIKFELPCNKHIPNNLILFWTPSYTDRKNFVLKQLQIDCIFMSALFPFVFVWYFLTRSRLQYIDNGKWDKFLIWAMPIVGPLQLVAWAFDFCENLQSELWIHAGRADDNTLFKTLVISKFVIFITSLILVISLSIWNCIKIV